MKTEDPGDVRRSRLEAVREEIRDFFSMGNTSGAATSEWFDLRSKLAADQETADPLWSTESFVPGESERIKL